MLLMKVSGEVMDYEEIGAEMRNEKNALILQGLVKELFDTYLNRVEESDSGTEFSPITLSCCRVMMLEPLNDLLTKMAKLSGAKEKVTYE